MKNSIIILLISMILLNVQCNKSHSRIKSQIKNKNKAKKLSVEQQKKAEDMLQMLNQFLKNNNQAPAVVTPAVVTPPGATPAVVTPAVVTPAAVIPAAAGSPPATPPDPRFFVDKQTLKGVIVQNVIPAATPNDQFAQLIMEDQQYIPTDYKDLEVTKECELKQGYLGLVTDISSGDQFKLSQPILTAKACFVVLNKKSLSFFNKENINALVKTVDIQHLKPSYYPTTWNGLFCWQLIPSNTIAVLKEMITKVPAALPADKVSATICAPTQSSMDDWLRAIQRFHNCVVQPLKVTKVVKEESEEDKLNGWYKVLKTRKIQEEADDDQEAQQDDDHESNLLKDYMSKFKEDVLNKKAEEAQQRREKTVELEAEVEKVQIQEDENKCLDRALEIKSQEEEKQVEQMLQGEYELKEKKALQVKKEELMSKLDKESQRIIESQSDLTDAVRKMREEMKSKMVQTITTLTGNQDPDMCYFMETIFPPALKYTKQKITYTCEQLIDPQNVDIDLTNQCLLEQSFCRVCCNLNIGEIELKQREDCQTKCQDQIAGNVPSDAFHMDFDIEQNSQKIDADKAIIAAKILKDQEAQMANIMKTQGQDAAQIQEDTSKADQLKAAMVKQQKDNESAFNADLDPEILDNSGIKPAIPAPAPAPVPMPIAPKPIAPAVAPVKG